MNIALIIAGGSGQRMNQDIPKQFININDKPLIIYTLESFQCHPDIDFIEVVCLDGWHDILRAYSKQYQITKLKWIISGGDSGQESIFNGIKNLRGDCADDDIVVIHDGIRPLVDSAVLSDVLVKCQKHGNGVTSQPYNEQLFIATDDYTTQKYIPRDTIRRVQTPQAYRYGKLLWVYNEAFSKNIGIGLGSYANTLMVDLGETLYFAAGSEMNIKITTPEDLDLFKAILMAKK